MQRKKLHIPLTLMTIGLIVLMAGLTSGTLVIARRLQRRTTARTAAYRVLDAGRRITAHLAAHTDMPPPDEAEPDWNTVRQLVTSMYAVENALQYVSISRDDVVLFHQQTRALDSAAVEETEEPTGVDGSIRLYPQVVQAGESRIPVVVFSQEMERNGLSPTRIDVALRQAAVWREELAASQALAAMFRLAMVTLTLSFAVCGGLIIWMMRREARREARRRTSEHLAFSGVLANGIVHDFRNPMSSMRLDVQMLNREIARGNESRPERIAKLADRIRTTLDRMDSVFAEFMALSRSPHDRAETISLKACIEACIQIMRPRIERTRIQIALRILDDTPLSVTAHPGPLRRAFLNVLTNAEQWSPPGTTVNVTLQREYDMALISVTDAGPGIPPKQRSRIFDLFFTTRPEGNGLGLFLAAETIERMGGSIRVAESPSPGTSIEIRLPLDSTSKGRDKHVT